MIFNTFMALSYARCHNILQPPKLDREQLVSCFGIFHYPTVLQDVTVWGQHWTCSFCCRQTDNCRISLASLRSLNVLNFLDVPYNFANKGSLQCSGCFCVSHAVHWLYSPIVSSIINTSCTNSFQWEYQNKKNIHRGSCNTWKWEFVRDSFDFC